VKGEGWPGKCDEWPVTWAKCAGGESRGGLSTEGKSTSPEQAPGPLRNPSGLSRGSELARDPALPESRASSLPRTQPSRSKLRGIGPIANEGRSVNGRREDGGSGQGGALRVSARSRAGGGTPNSNPGDWDFCYWPHGRRFCCAQGGGAFSMQHRHQRATHAFFPRCQPTLP
jgi:hypothetical protein